MEFVELATLIWASLWTWHAIRRLLDGDRNSLLIIYLVFYAEYVVPLGLDLTVGMPGYSEQPGFSVSAHNAYVRLLYCVFVFIVPLTWLWTTKRHNGMLFTKSPAWVNLMLRLSSLLPVLLVLAAPDPSLYLKYAGIMSGNAPINVLVFHIVVSMATMIAVLCAAGRCLVGSISKRMIIEVAFAMAIASWINGKRYIVAEALLFAILALWYRGAVTGKKLVWTMLAGIFFLSAFSVTYQLSVRNISYVGSSTDEATDGARVDFTRDSRVKMVIYSELYPEKMQILQYRGQNLFYYASLPIPRSFWKDKPYPYAMYFTSAMLNIYPHDLGWGMTTGIFDETIANCGLMGMIIGPLLIRWLCAIGNSLTGWSVHILTCVVGSLLLSVQLAAFVPLMAIWLIAVAKGIKIPFWRDSSSSTTKRRVDA